MLPPFIMSENSQMFEMAGIPYYIKFMDNSRQGKRFLQDYLKEKAVYHQNRSDFLRTFFERSVNDTEKTNITKGINYEDAQSIVLRHPTDDILKIEIKKLQFLSNFRDAHGQTDIFNPGMNYVTAPSSHLMILSAIQELRHEIALQKKQKFISSAKREYLKYTEEYAKYWFDNICSWIDGVFDMALHNAKKTKFNENKGRFDHFENLTDLYKFFGEKYRSRYTQEFNLPQSTAEAYKGIRKETSNMFKESIYLDFDAKITRKLNEIKKLNEKLKEAIKNNWGFDVLNLSILSIVKNRELYSILESKPSSKARDILTFQLYKTEDMYQKIAESSYRHLFAKIWLDAPEKKTLTGYKGMYNFG